MKYLTNRKMNVRTLRHLSNNEGVTLRNGKIIEYRSGWQVASMGVKCLSAEEAMKYTRWFSNNGKQIGRNVGVWFSDGTYYVDICQRVPTKREAVEEGRRFKQLSIYYWGQRKEALEWL